MASEQEKSPVVAGLLGGAGPGGSSLLGGGNWSPLTSAMRTGTQGEWTRGSTRQRFFLKKNYGPGEGLCP
jgi:hypothetical protein